MQPTEGANLHRQANLSGKADSGGTRMAQALVCVVSLFDPAEMESSCLPQLTFSKSP
jgi:hypothetical protein